LANNINILTNKKIHTMGLKDKSAGASLSTDNLPPTKNEIIKKVLSFIKK